MKCFTPLLLLQISLPFAICKAISGRGLMLPADAPQGLLMWTETDSFTNYTVHPFPETYNETDISDSVRNGSGVKHIGPRLNPLPISKTGCSPLNKLTADDAMEATWRLKMHCDIRTRHAIEIGARNILALHQGAGWAYVCNWAGSPNFNRCDGMEVLEAMDTIDRTCGPAAVGWVLMDQWAKSYGREVDTVEICPGICRVGMCGMISSDKANGEY
ncbi:hypothetical protein SLS62_008241 [Diatrype stigma]|uniref:SCP domain-containing protein n=1 Tax=Diatrype stigma TaxID=117547 RepID=A0AAN9UKR8_9PEZI